MAHKLASILTVSLLPIPGSKETISVNLPVDALAACFRTLPISNAPTTASAAVHNRLIWCSDGCLPRFILCQTQPCYLLALACGRDPLDVLTREIAPSGGTQSATGDARQCEARGALRGRCGRRMLSSARPCCLCHVSPGRKGKEMFNPPFTKFPHQKRLKNGGDMVLSRV